MPPPPTGLITDEECAARGGHVETQDTYAYLDRRRRDEPRTPFRVCRVPSPQNGQACSDESGCAGGRCWCVGALSRPNPQDDPTLVVLDGVAGLGRCDDRPIESGVWRCLVGGGVIHLHGIIVD